MAVVEREIEGDATFANRLDDRAHALVFLTPPIDLNLKADRDAERVAELGGLAIGVDDLLIGDLMPIRRVGVEHDVEQLYPRGRRVAHILDEFAIVLAELVTAVAGHHRNAGLFGRLY